MAFAPKDPASGTLSTEVRGMQTVRRGFGGALIGALAMYWLDPTSGRRRRARLADQLVHAAARSRRLLDAGGRDLAHRIQGMGARARGAVFDGGPCDDQVLADRVRAGLGRAVSHPGSVEVTVREGHVLLRGPVLAHEHRQLLRAVERTRGVKSVEDHLSVHRDANGIPGLQGGYPRQPPRFELLQENWSPAARLTMAAAGAALVLYGLKRRDGFGTIAATLGATCLMRSTLNVPLKRLAGATGRRAIDVQKTLHVNAPVDQVFDLFARYENFPAIMRNVRSVHMGPDGRSHWRVAGPAGVSVAWDAVTTAFERNRVIAWRTVRNAAIHHAGIVRFEPEDGGTRLEIHMSYNPPAGALGHVAAKIFGADPKSELDEDLLRLKSYMETGKLPRDAAAHGAANAPAREPVAAALDQRPDGSNTGRSRPVH
jgi:uncharacterized membrane protein